MIAFEVKDMTCGHCASTITKAVQAADKDARVAIDLASHRVEIEPAQADAANGGVLRGVDLRRRQTGEAQEEKQRESFS